MIRKLTFTPEEQEERKRLWKQVDELLDSNTFSPSMSMEASKVYTDRISEIQEEALKRYVKELSEHPEDIPDTLNEALSECKKDVFLKYADGQRTIFEGYYQKFKDVLKSGSLPKGANVTELRKLLRNDEQYIKENFKHNFLSAYRYILGMCDEIISACHVHDIEHPEEPIKGNALIRVRLKADSFFKCRIKDFDPLTYPWADGFSYPSFVEKASKTISTELEPQLPKYISPTKAYLTTDNLKKNIYDGEMKNMNTPYDVVMSKKGKYVSVTSYTLTLDDGRPTEKYDPPDESVCNAISSIIDKGNEYFTSLQVYRTMNGMTDGQEVSPQMIEAIEKSIEKQWTTLIDIDPRGSYYGKDYTDTIKAHLLSLEVYQRKSRSDGTKFTVYHALNLPILYRHAKELGNVITVDMDYLSIMETKAIKSGNSTKYRVLDTRVPSSMERQSVKEYLIQRIEGMKTKNALKQDTILFDKLYSRAGYDNPNKENKRTVRDYVKAVLQYYQAIGKIKAFEFIKDKKTIHSVKIKV